MPKPSARWATSWPMRPKPSTPSVLSYSSTPLNSDALPGAPGERAVRLRHLARQREQQRERVLGGRDHVRLRRVGDDHAALGGGVDVHVVHPHPGAADGLQALRPGEQVRVELGGGADQDAVELADPAFELVLVPVEAELDVEPGVAQQLHAGVADLLPYEDLHA